jgi:MFS family permease
MSKTSSTTGLVDIPPDSVREVAYTKVARHIMPLAFGAFFITYVDRANLGIVGSSMEKDLHISPAGFGLAAGLFYIGYLIMEVPSNILLERFGGRKWFARILATFGIISGVTVFVWNGISLDAVRILLGAGEAGLYPGMLLFIGYWFNEKQRGSQWLIFQISLPLSLAVGALVSTGLLNLDGVLGIAGWRWVFLGEAFMTIVVAVLIYTMLPDHPRDARWLDADEAAAVAAESDIAKPRPVHGLSALVTVIKSPVAWYVMFLYFCSLVGFLTVTYWAPQIINERFAIGDIGSGFLSAVPWVVSCLSLMASSWIMTKKDRHAGIIVVAMVVCGIGMIISSMAGSAVLALFGLCLAATQQSVVPLSYMYIRAHFSLELCAVAFAFVNSLANLSGLVGPWLLGVLIEITGSTRTGLLALSGFFWIAAILGVFAPAFIRRQERLRALRAC